MHCGKTKGTAKRQGPEREFFIPEMCSAENFLVVIVGTELMAIMFILLHVEPLLPRLVRLGQYSLYMQLIAMLSSATLCCGRRWLSGLRTLPAMLISLAVTPAIAGLVAVATWWLLTENELYEAVIGVPLHSLLWHSVFIAFIISAMCLRYIYAVQQWRRRMVHANEARFQALRAKLRPHFLFNTMNTISAMLHDNPQRSEQAITDLCSLLRSALNADENSSLGDELRLCHSYLDLEGLRLGPRLRLEWQIESLPKDAWLPAMSLQPLLENAVYHGIETLVDGGTVSVRGHHEDGRVHIEIRNDTGGHKPERKLQGHHQGQLITQARLRHAFSSGLEFSSEQLDQHYLVRISFPYRTTPPQGLSPS